MTDETDLRLPAPPDDYTEAERDAFYAGARRYVQALGGQHDLILAALANGPTADTADADDTDDAPTDTQADDTCPACGEDAVTAAFGTTRCTACDAVLD